MTNHKLMPIVGTVIASLILIAFLIWVSWTQSNLTGYDPNDYGPSGLKAIQLLLRKEGYQTGKIFTLDRDDTGLVIAFTPVELSRNQRKKVLAWVESGGTIIELAQFSPALTPKETPNRIRMENLNSDHQSKVSISKVEWLGNLQYHIGGDLVFTTARPDEGYFAIGKNFFIYRYVYGKGRIIHWNDPDGLTNLHIKENPDNAVIFAMLVKRFSQSNRIAFFDLTSQMEKPIPPVDLSTEFTRFWLAGLLAVVGIGLLLWKISVRLGRPRPLILAKGRSADEFIYSAASLFQQANARTIVIDSLLAELWQTIRDITGLPVGSEPGMMIARLQIITGKNYDAILELSAGIHNPNTSKRDFLKIALSLDTYRKELKEWRKL
jgi:hypothetical protein